MEKIIEESSEPLIITGILMDMLGLRDSKNWTATEKQSYSGWKDMD